MLIWFMNKIYLFFILVCCVQSSASLFLPLRFSLPLIKITQKTDKGRGSKSTNHRIYTDLGFFPKDCV